MSTAAHHLVARDVLTALAPLVTYPVRCWLALSPPPRPERQPAAIVYYGGDAVRRRAAA
jgi:hypothetical protein